MYKLMIVEDEDIVREGMVHLIDFESLGYRIVASCENGREALEQFYKVLPDVVLTDICMAEMDGFEFINHIYSEQLHTKFIIISGHDDFSYMKQALKYKVTDYILKPVIARELRELLSEVKAKLDKELKELVDLNSLKSDQLRAEFLKKQNFFNKIVGIRLEESVIREQAAEVGVAFAEPLHTVLVLDCGERETAIEANNLSGEDMLTFMIYNVAEEFAKAAGQKYVFTDYTGRTLLLLSGRDSEQLAGSGKRIAAETLGYFRKTFGVKLSARMGNVVSELIDLNKTFQQANSLFLVDSADELLYYPEWERRRSKVQFPAVQIAEELENALAGESDERERDKRVAAAVSRMFGRELVSTMDFENLKNHVLIVGNLVSEKFDAMDVKIPAFELDSKEKSADTADKLRLAFADWMEDAAKFLSTQNSSKLMLMNRVFACIGERYRDFEFSGEDVCRAVNISTSYLSSLFKAVTGTTFTKYLNAYRIGKAKELLRCTDKNVAEIAESVGYLNSAYFGLVFKNATGLSPNAFRKKDE